MDSFYLITILLATTGWVLSLKDLNDVQSCQSWAKAGYCTKYYKDYMNKYCARSCAEWTSCQKFNLHWWKDGPHCKQFMQLIGNDCNNVDAYLRDVLRKVCQLSCRYCNPPTTAPPSTKAPTIARSTITPQKCGRRDPKFTRIIGGQDAKQGEWPWQVLIDKKNDQYDRWCGGSLVTEEWVVSAAHCFVHYPDPKKYRVIAGDLIVNETSKWEQTSDVAEIITHPNYSDTDDNQWYDVALVRLKTKVKLNSNIRTICLDGDEYGISHPVGKNCTITGWGKTKTRGPSSKWYPQVLQKAEVPIVDLDVCDKRLRYYDMHKSQICAGYDQGRIDSCGGDSGGPLACENNGVWYLVGASSFGIECARPYTPGVYSNIKNVRKFIDQYIKQEI